MPRYENLEGDSTITHYKIGPDRIKVRFSDSSVYEYSYDSAGRENIEHMKQLARDGEGLQSFINRNVRFDYESKRRP